MFSLRFRLFGLMLLMSMTHTIWGQSPSLRPAFVPAHLFMKLSDDVDMVIPPMEAGEEVWANQTELQALYSIAQSLGITKIERPFRTHTPQLDRTYLLTYGSEENCEAIIRSIAALPFVDYVEREPMYYVDYIPNDYNASNQYFIQKTKADLAWDLTKGDTNVVIAIVDAAVLTTHVDLAANIYRNWVEINGTTGIDDDNNGYIDDVMGWDAGDSDNDPNPPMVNNFDHGTHVAGCASAVADNGIGVAGMGFRCKILPIKAKSNGSSSSSGLDATIAGVDYAVSSKIADIINMSFGGAGGLSQTWQNLIDAAYYKGIVVIAAAGNDNTLSDGFYPASYNHVICVGSTDASDSKSWFSNYGSTIDVMAPGSSIRSTVVWGVSPPLSGYANWDGTSMASPVVAGLAGLMLSANPSLSVDALESCLKQTCDNIDAMNPSHIGEMGAGRINASAAVNCVIPSVAPVAAFNYNVVSACGGQVQFINQSSNLQTTWSWNFGNGMTSSQPNPLISFTTSGNYTVSLTVTNPIGSSTATQNILINALPEPVVDAGLNADICVGESVNLAATTSLAGTILWTPNTGLSNTNTLTPIASPTTSRTYILTITAPNGCDGQDSIHIGVSPSPTVWAGNDVTINAGDSTQLSPAGSNNLLYSWQPSTGLSNPAIKNPKASPAGTTYYLLTVTNTFGCTKSDWVLVTVNGGVTSISANGTTNFNVSPNPFANDLWISAEFLEAHHMSLSLFDITGKFVANIWEGEVQQGSFDYNWQNTLPAGLYFLEYKTEETIFRQKLIRE